ncbi:hypothetical protein [Streptococcus equi]|uniref:Phage protein n=1 Tax=Streptococcus equi subsp. ruminatorum CECT 5772 TaxID=1051981 RepID=A0A922T5V2_9STRE|nr:hypothetical protein [Streptococcus equi]KED04182.1 phage protein [Streptococcus equi subsp. ruminatorum CECT 5772]
MNSNLKKRVDKLRRLHSLDNASGLVFVEYEDGKYQIKKQDHVPKFQETKLIAELETEEEAERFLNTIPDGYVIFWDIIPEDD